MGHTNSTANYNLPQFVGTDKPTWLGDINNAFSAIDTAIANAASTANTADGKADALGTVVSSHTTQIGTLSNTVTAHGNTLNTVTALIGNGTPTTTDQTIIGAINELNADKVNQWTFVDSVNYTGAAGADNSKTVTIPSGWKALLLLITISDAVYASTEVLKNSVTENNAEAIYAGVDTSGSHTIVVTASLAGTTLKARHQYNKYGNSISVDAKLYYR